MKKTAAGFGPYLLACRIAKEVGIDEVARVTRIGAQTLRLIEAQDLERLPAPVFVQGFLRAYAKAVGADGDEAVRLYQAMLAQRDNPIKSAPDSDPVRGPTWYRLLILLVVMLVWMALSVWLSSLTHRDANVAAAMAGQASPTAPAQALFADQPDVFTEKTDAAHRMEISAVADTWVQVAIDGQAPRHLRFKAGHKAALGARKAIVLMAGDAAAVSLQFNGLPLPTQGSRGQVKTLHLP